MAPRSPAPRSKPGESSRDPASGVPVSGAAASRPRAVRAAERRARRRQIIAALLPAQALLAGIVIVGMVTGLGGGSSGATTVVTVELAGAVCLALLALGISGGVALRRGRGRRFPWWALLSLPTFVFWAALRVSEFSS